MPCGQSSCIRCSLDYPFASMALHWNFLIVLPVRRVKDAGEIEAAKPVQEGLTAEHLSALLSTTEAQPGDLLLIAAGPQSTVNKCADAACRLYHANARQSSSWLRCDPLRALLVVQATAACRPQSARPADGGTDERLL